ncbi:LamG domain-containing protein [Flavivirga aquimarina]|uniref:LamG domain-containing protein n=1 Tax=Flavivirga aquimarina TaxID=2027862 RepID=A0ABT8W8M1_9FLAO|nr:LamG domain-containing protein [Flavivirga aquimarina]MDO5969431.1 LamG domain-containing protein [Flavivirga aquimarina]
MKNNKLTYLIILVALLFQACQDLNHPELGDFPLDPPVITLFTPNLSGTTSIQTPGETGSVTFKFDVTDDLGLSNISLNLNGAEIYSISDFTDNMSFSLDEFVYDDVPLGSHTVELVATDTDSNETIISTTLEIIEQLYSPLFDGEFFYMPFENDYEDLVSASSAVSVGSPTFSGDPFLGVEAFSAPTDSYINFPINQLTEALGAEFSGAFWYKASGDPDRAGIIVVGDDADDRRQGFRLFREGSDTAQTIKMNVGTGTGESWNNGGVIDVTAGEWVHVAFTIAPTETKIYLNGTLVNTATPAGAIDWTNCENITIGAGGATFSYWGHNSDTGSSLDELRFFNKALAQRDVNAMIAQGSKVFNMAFDGDYQEGMSGTDATTVGTPGFAGEAYAGSDAFKSATDSYITFPLATIGLGTEFSAAFRYKVNASPDRSGLIVVGDDADDRRQGFRLFREGSDTEQTIKLNVGTGTGETWNNGGVIDVTAGEWVHVAFTVSETETKVYLDGVLVNTGTMAGPIDFTGCTDLVIGSGGPTFSYWGHLSDESPMDELQFFNKELSEEEIQSMQ